MDYPEILGVGKDELVFASAGILLFLLMYTFMIGHAQVDNPVPENISDLNKTGCQLAKWQTNATYHWNESLETCEKQVQPTEAESSG